MKGTEIAQLVGTAVRLGYNVVNFPAICAFAFSILVAIYPSATLIFTKAFLFIVIGTVFRFVPDTLDFVFAECHLEWSPILFESRPAEYAQADNPGNVFRQLVENVPFGWLPRRHGVKDDEWT